MNALRHLPSVTFGPIAPAGFVLLWALQQTANESSRDLTITSGTDGVHSGPTDPHHSGNAFDVRSHDFAPSEKNAFVQAVLSKLGSVAPQDGGYVTSLFFGWLEAVGTANEHFHFQLRHGLMYPPSNNAEDIQDAATAT